MLKMVDMPFLADKVANEGNERLGTVALAAGEGNH